MSLTLLGVGGPIGHPNLINGLLSWWNLDEASGATGIDSHGDNDLTDVNTVGQVSTGGICAGSGASFTAGNTTRLELSNAAASELQMGTGDLSIACWLRGPAEPTLDFARPFAYGESFDEIGYKFSRGSTGDHAIFHASATGDTSQFGGVTVGGVFDTTWHFLAYTVDRDGNLIGYLDGSQVDFTDISADSTDDVTTNLPFGLGCSFEEAGAQFIYDGDMAGAAIWDRVLTPGDVSDFYSGGSSLRYSDL